ncbi:DUF6361 family protein [Eubacterium sp. MSJ-33]|uniref:DUF6361 family protein n=1 Tax=Eubacterium sp. MSJ-33 TaxID=2841528 RepID=UPI001C75E189|nr:DUF6361 family protein [Eubacterium sp. MSJ-33]QWT52774.1 hypothetical protein KP625_12020 [Eubacterium sp. MSJ-33]
MDYEEEQRKNVTMLLKNLGEPSVMDELGFLTIKRRISDCLYPGISTNLTLAKYYILIPMIFRSALSENRQQVVKHIREMQDKTTGILAEYRKKQEETTDKIRGIIGGKRTPMNVYWSSLRKFGILKRNVGNIGDACSRVARGEDVFDFEIKTTLKNFFDSKENNPLELTQEEKEALKAKMLQAEGIQNSLLQYCLVNNLSLQEDQFPNSDTINRKNKQYDLAIIKTRVTDAGKLSLLMEGIYAVYNLIFLEKNGTTTQKEINQEKLKKIFHDWLEKYNKNKIKSSDIDLIMDDYVEAGAYREALCSFLKNFIENIEEISGQRVENPEDIKISNELTNLIIDREKYCKQDRAELGKKGIPFEEKKTTLDFRHGVAQKILKDII